MDASLAVQKALRARFITTAAVTALVPASNIIDRSQRPVLDPSIVLGEDQVIDAGIAVARDYVRCFSNIHIWVKEPSMERVKGIAGAIRRSLGRVRRLDLAEPDYFCSDVKVNSSRFLRDPGGEFSHGILTVETLIQERWSAEI